MLPLKSIIFVNSDSKARQLLAMSGLYNSDTVENAMNSNIDCNYYHCLFTDSAFSFFKLNEYNSMYPNLFRDIRTFRDKNFIKYYLPIGSSVIHSINYKHNVICSIISYTEYCDISGTDNLYYAIIAMLKLWPSEGVLIVNTDNLYIDFLSIHNIKKGIENFYQNSNNNDFELSDFFIPKLPERTEKFSTLRLQ